VAPYLALVREDAPQREYDLREVFNALSWIVRTGSAWRYMSHDLPPWEAPYTSRRGGGFQRAFSRRWSTICAYCCGFFAGTSVRANGDHTRFAHPAL
jgi:transposase